MRQGGVTAGHGGAAIDAPRVGVAERLAMAGELLSGLALLGSPERAALDRVQRGTSSEVEDLVAAIDVVAGQARIATEAGRCAGQQAPRAGWLAGTAPHWQEYLGWLRDELASLAARAEGLGGWSRQQVDTALRAARDECLAAHLQWTPVG